jgi:GYF domain 2
LFSRSDDDFVTVLSAMRFHVAREGAVMGEFEEQIFRNKVFSGEIRPNDLYWTAGFADWRPVSEFRVARKTEPILLDTGSAVPPAIGKLRQRSAPAIALICVCALVLLIGVAMMAGKFKSGRVPQHARVEAKAAIARGQLRVGMTADQCIRMLGQPTRIERISGSKNEQWTYEGQGGPVILHFENGLLRSF